MVKTADGKFRLAQIIKVAELLLGVSIEKGSNHRYLIKYSEAPVGNCALASSTWTDQHLVPWFKKITGLNKNQIYESLRQGAWVN